MIPLLSLSISQSWGEKQLEQFASNLATTSLHQMAMIKINFCFGLCWCYHLYLNHKCCQSMQVNGLKMVYGLWARSAFTK